MYLAAFLPDAKLILCKKIPFERFIIRIIFRKTTVSSNIASNLLFSKRVEDFAIRIFLIMFFTFLEDIHAQPNMFKKSEVLNIEQIPDNMGIDLFLYLYFKNKKYKIKRFNVNFLKRRYGFGSNDNFKQKLAYIPKAIKSSIQILSMKKFK